MSYLTEVEPARGVPIDVLPGIRRVVARNPSLMTYHGTNTYLLDHEDGLTVIDPGPDDAEHVRDVLQAAGDKPITRVVVTHAHHDHHGAVKKLQEATGAPSWGYARSGSPQHFDAQNKLADGDEVAGLRAVHTPGHATDHLSFAYQVPGIGQILFSGDHVMAWSSSIVNPPEGNMREYYRALELLLPREDRIYLPGHGPMEHDPKALVRELLKHRLKREAAILEALTQGPQSVADISAQLYAKTDFILKMAARRNVLAHLLKLEEEGRAAQLDGAPPLQVLSENAQAEDQASSEPSFLKIAEQDALRRFRQV